ncbi:fumarylacetoacetate hydrolase family protein [Phanerochaete sordida]|uniref:Fumarylacetoacetate hydrolase family protein n=1 Tax=Phanerochaete sordida TaxID=48140 RepID=A0A9P3G2E5_9APHY|nr:fumarylacetoacetate hydrolase family protein [Phanerochaete sordida]
MAAAAFLRHGKKIVAIGRNYADHVKELNNAIPKEPFFFLKPTTSYLPSGGNVEIPRGIVAHHEVELGLVIGKRGRDIAPADADAYIAGYALAVDMTARNLQDEVKKKGLPWSAVKGFDTFTPVSAFVPRAEVADAQNLNLSLKINGALKQSGNTSSMLFPIPRLLAHISSIMTLEEGDLVLTGTPSGIGPLKAGDAVECVLADPSGRQLATLSFGAVDREGGYHYQAAS